MNREEAQNLLNNSRPKGNNAYSIMLNEALNMAIKALEQEPCDNAVSRQDVLDLAKKGVLISNGNYESVCKAINELSPVNPTKTGHWIREKERHFLDTRTNENVEMKEATGKGYHTYINVQCSKCRKITIHDDSILYQYCPHCGAKMVEPQESNDKCKNCEYYRNPDYTRCHECKAERSDKE